MKAMLCKAFGPPESLVFEDAPSPKVGKRGVRIAVHAAGLNFPDTLMIAGKYQFKPEFPFAPGMECAGTVLEVGAGVTHVKVGDRVMASTGHGSFAEEVVTDMNAVYPIPANLEYVTAASMPITYGTTLYALADRGHLKAGETLLVHGAAGGVGLNAVELGRLMGANVIGTVGSDEKAEIVRKYGAQHVINYSKESIKDRVKEITGDKGADVIYDAVGGDAFDQSLRCIAWEGRLLVIGFASGRIPSAPANLVLLKSCQIVGVFWGAFTQRDPDKNRANMTQLVDWAASGKIKPHVSMTFPLEDTAKAMEALLARKTTGKVVVVVRK